MLVLYCGQGNETGDAADDCSSAARRVGRVVELPGRRMPPEGASASGADLDGEGPSTFPVRCTSPLLARSRSYRHIIEEVEEASLFQSRCTPQIVTISPVITSFKNIEPSRVVALRPKTTKL